ncbi:hypothetical protein QBC44DRAFT_294223 [Cladorrhinum sp. PSN332]|nr:hypothetical protein QBC44DRAFT_294223 [Cladorrhinum sp. PSN332]
MPSKREIADGDVIFICFSPEAILYTFLFLFSLQISIWIDSILTQAECIFSRLRWRSCFIALAHWQAAPTAPNVQVPTCSPTLTGLCVFHASLGITWKRSWLGAAGKLLLASSFHNFTRRHHLEDWYHVVFHHHCRVFEQRGGNSVCHCQFCLLASVLDFRLRIFRLSRRSIAAVDGSLLRLVEEWKHTIMAQASVVGVVGGQTASGSGLITSQLPPSELHEVRQYEKLLRFRDDVISGKHPRIKPPASALGKGAQGSKPSAASTSPTPATSEFSRPNGTNSVPNGKRPVNIKLQPSQMSAGLPGLGNLPSSRPFGKQPEINPVFLQKSDDLIKAEIQLQRQRLERSLKDEIEQRRIKASDQMAELDVADIWAKALTLTQDTLARPTDEPEPAANTSAASDSFDDNTFYSSQHGTPDSQMAARIPIPSDDDDEMRDASPYEPQFDPEPAVGPVYADQPIPGVNTQQKQPEINTSAPAAPFTIPGVTVPGLSLGAVDNLRAYGHPHESGNTGSGQPSDLARVNERLLGRNLGQQPSPLIRGHDLSPIAPQPERVSPLAPLASLARQPHLAASESSGRRATPAQVAALRKQPSNASSPDSSSQGNNRAEKKKNKKEKKKKRKAERMAAAEAATAPTPYIKPEPRSPSPLAAGTAAPYARPNKRQKQTQQQPPEFAYAEHRYEQPTRVEEGFQESYQPRAGRHERVVGYERADPYRTRLDDEPVLITSPRYETVYYDEARGPLSARSVHPDSPSAPPGQYVSREVRAVRPVSRVVDASFEDAPFYRDVRTASRMSVRPAQTAYRERSQSPILMFERPRATMAPPRAPARRIIIDADGREYLEPIVREVAPIERVFERVTTARAVSRRPEILDDDAVVYQPTSPAYAAPRRVVTQPEFVIPDHRAYREAGVPGSAMAPPSAEYAPTRSEPPREYITRPTSVRPQVEPVRFDSAYEERVLDIYGPRSASVRPAAENIRYEAPVGYERRIVNSNGVEEYVPLRSASVRPIEGVRYDYGTPSRVGSMRLPEYTGAVRRGDGMQPPPHPPPQGARAYSVMPGGAEQRREFSMQPGGVERYNYGRRPQQQGDDDEVVFLERAPQRGDMR